MKEWLLPPKAAPPTREASARETRRKTRTTSHTTSATRFVIILTSVQRKLSRVRSTD